MFNNGGTIIDYTNEYIHTSYLRYLLKVHCAWPRSRAPQALKYGSTSVQTRARRQLSYFPDKVGLNWPHYQFDKTYQEARAKFDGGRDSPQLEALLIETYLEDEPKQIILIKKEKDDTDDDDDDDDDKKNNSQSKPQIRSSQRKEERDPALPSQSWRLYPFL